MEQKTMARTYFLILRRAYGIKKSDRKSRRGMYSGKHTARVFNEPEIGQKRGKEEKALLTQKLLSDNRIDDLKKASEDEGYREALCREYKILGNVDN